MHSVIVIAVNTFKEAIRNRVLYIILMFAILMLLGTGVMSDLSISSPNDIVRSMGLAGMNFFSLLIAVFVGIGLVYNEIDKKTIYTIVSKPIDRTHFILGKFFGLLLTLYVNILIMSLFFFFTIYFYHDISTSVLNERVMKLISDQHLENVGRGMLYGYYAQSICAAAGKAMISLFGWSNELSRDLLKVILMNCFELAIVVAFAVLFSAFSTPTLSAMLTVMTFLAGRGNEHIIRYAWKLESRIDAAVVFDFALNFKYWLAMLVAHLAPNLSIFNRAADAIYAEEGVIILPTEILYGFVYPAGVLVLAILIFKHRNFK